MGKYNGEKKRHNLILESGCGVFPHAYFYRNTNICLVKCKNSHLFHYFEYDMVVQREPHR